MLHRQQLGVVENDGSESGHWSEGLVRAAYFGCRAGVVSGFSAAQEHEWNPRLKLHATVPHHDQQFVVGRADSLALALFQSLHVDALAGEIRPVCGGHGRGILWDRENDCQLCEPM